MIISNDRDQKLRLDEYTHVEKPFLDQLAEQHWQTIELDMHHQTPEGSFRQNYGEVVLKPKLTEALKKINSFLDEIKQHFFCKFSFCLN